MYVEGQGLKMDILVDISWAAYDATAEKGSMKN